MTGMGLLFFTKGIIFIHKGNQGMERRGIAITLTKKVINIFTFTNQHIIGNVMDGCLKR